jgi:hypothetical protein
MSFPKIRYHYVTVPQDAVIGAARLLTEPDAYIASDPETEGIKDLLTKGYRWIRSEDGFAVFERAFGVYEESKP